MDAQVVTYWNTMFRESESKVKLVPEFVIVGIIFIFKRGTFSSLLMVSGDENSERVRITASLNISSLSRYSH